jgi:hypothetical protein
MILHLNSLKKSIILDYRIFFVLHDKLSYDKRHLHNLKILQYMKKKLCFKIKYHVY